MEEIPSGMLETKEKFEASLLERPGVVGVGVGLVEVDGELTETIAIKIYVEPGHAVISQLPTSLDGHPVNVVERTFVPLAQAEVLRQESAGADAKEYDPLVGGISCGPCRSVDSTLIAGTLGAVVLDKSTGRPMLLSNYHVLAVNTDWRVGNEVVQPGLPDSFTQTCAGVVVGTLERAKLDGSVDAAVAWQTDRDFDWSIVDIGPINGTVRAAYGLPVAKRGRTTGLTFGKIVSTDVAVTIDYPFGVGKVTLTHQIDVAPDRNRNRNFTDHGDSGSVVVDSETRVVGLLFARSRPEPHHGLLNPITAVTKELGIAIPSSDEVLSLRNKVVLTEHASSAPVLATAEGRQLVLAFSGTDRRINIEVSTDGMSFGGKVTLDERTLGEPAIVLAANGNVQQADYVAWTGTDGRINVAKLGPNWTIVNHVPLNEHSDNNSALAMTGNGTLVLAWAGAPNQELNVAVSTDGGKSFPDKLTLEKQHSALGPWIANIDGKLYLLWRGTNNDYPNIAQITSLSPISVDFPTPINTEHCNTHPSLASAGQLVLAWTGTDKYTKVNVAAARSGLDFRDHVVFDEASVATPMLCRYKETLYMAWTGTERSINVAALRIPAM
jgi:hypothetical protein